MGRRWKGEGAGLEIKLVWNWDRLGVGGDIVHCSRIFTGKRGRLWLKVDEFTVWGRGHVTGRNDKSSEKLRRTKN